LGLPANNAAICALTQAFARFLLIPTGSFDLDFAGLHLAPVTTPEIDHRQARMIGDARRG